MGLNSILVEPELYSLLSFDRIKLKSPLTFGNEDDTKGDIACRPIREFVAVASLELDSLAVRKDDASVLRAKRELLLRRGDATGKSSSC